MRGCHQRHVDHADIVSRNVEFSQGRFASSWSSLITHEWTDLGTMCKPDPGSDQIHAHVNEAREGLWSLRPAAQGTEIEFEWQVQTELEARDSL